jgi:hypothetical protein
MKSALKVNVRNVPVFCSRWMYLSHEGYSPFSQLDQSEHREGSIGVLWPDRDSAPWRNPRDASASGKVLSLGSHTRLFTIALFVSIGQWTIPVRTLIGKIPRVGCGGFEKLPLILAPVSTIAVESSLITVQEVW